MNIPIFHMASFSRSGETLLQRCLNAHPDIEIVHQIQRVDTPEDLALFNHLMERAALTMPVDDPLLAHRKLGPKSVLVVKNAVWTHAHPRQGFTLVRNPFSVIMSAFRDAPDPDQRERQKRQQLRWARDIDPRMQHFMKNDDTLSSFLALYVRKLLQDRRDDLPFVRYEEFVAEPERWLRRIVAHLGLDWNDKVLKSHEDYPDKAIGHGGIKLSQPIHQGSTEKYKKLSPELQSHIYGLAHEVLLQYGYDWDGENLSTREVEGIFQEPNDVPVAARP